MPTKNPTKEQRTAWNLATRYKITQAQYDKMLEKQGGVCALCGCVMERPVVDHDHVTGVVRGILCHPCNVKLPAVEDSGGMMLALGYLSDTKSGSPTLMS